MENLGENNFSFDSDSKFDFSILENLNEAKNYKNKKIDDIVASDPDFVDYPLLTDFNEEETKVFYICLGDVTNDIDDFKVSVGPVTDPDLYDDKFPTIEEMGRLHGLDISQFKVFSILGLKMSLRMLEQRKYRLLPNKQKVLKKALNTFFKNKPFRGILVGPAGTGKSRILGCFFIG